MINAVRISESHFVSLRFGVSHHPALIRKPEHPLAGEICNAVSLHAFRDASALNLVGSQKTLHETFLLRATITHASLFGILSGFVCVHL
jgi:hypothetical protein